MKNYYVFVRNLGSFTHDSVVYTVTVGQSRRELVKLALVQEYVRDCGLYFHKRSDTTDRTLENLANGLFKGSSFASLHLRRVQVTISRLYELIIDDSFTEFENNLHCPKGLFRLITMFDPKSVPLPRFSNTKTPALPSSRKDLKSEGRQEFFNAVFGFGLILITFLVASLICATEQY